MGEMEKFHLLLESVILAILATHALREKSMYWYVLLLLFKCHFSPYSVVIFIRMAKFQAVILYARKTSKNNFFLGLHVFLCCGLRFLQATFCFLKSGFD